MNLVKNYFSNSVREETVLVLLNNGMHLLLNVLVLCCGHEFRLNVARVHVFVLD